MAHKNEYIPAKDAEFDDWLAFLVEYVGSKRGGPTPAWTHIPDAAYTALSDAYNAWYTAYLKMREPHTKVDTEAKNNAKAAAKAVVRPFVNQYLRFPPVTNEDRTAMGIPNRDVTPTPIPPPEDQAEALVSFPGIHLIELKIQPVPAPASSANKSDYGVRIYYGVMGTVEFGQSPNSLGASPSAKLPAADKFRLAAAPASGDDLPHSVFTRRAKHRFDFPEEDRSKTVYFCLRYENSKGQSGPWGPILSAVIP
jgi:hypothetical protein